MLTEVYVGNLFKRHLSHKKALQRGFTIKLPTSNMAYIFDLNSDRCLIEDQNGRHYEIETKNGHQYDALPVKIKLEGKVASYETSDGTFVFNKEEMELPYPFFVKSADNVAITAFSLDFYLPNTSDKINYKWTCHPDHKMLLPI